MANDYTLKEKGIIRADATKIYPSVDAMYGPWASVEAFRTYLGSILGGTVTDDIIPNSVEIGIIQSDGTVKRYEWQKPTNGEGQWVSKSDSGGAVASVNGKTGAVVLNKSDIGLGNVDNTADADKPISTATQTALNAKANASDLTSHTGSTSNPHGVTKAQVGLGNVDNTADADKIVKRATEDGSGNVITSTYETKTDAQSKITNLASDVADTYQTKTDSASAHTNLQSQITAIQTTVSNLTGLDGTNFGGFSIQQSDSLAVAGITTLYGQMGYTAGDVYWFLAGTSMASLKAYRFDGVQTDPVLISNDVYDFTDFSGLQTKVDKFKGTTNDIDSLNSGSDIGIYFYIGASKMGLVSVAYDATHSVVTQHWLSDMTPDSVDPNVLNEGPAILMRTYKNSAWSAWQNPIGELAAEVDALGSEIDQTRKEMFNIEQPLSFEDGVYQIINGELTLNTSTTSNWGYCIIPISEAIRVVTKASPPSFSTPAPAIIFLNGSTPSQSTYMSGEDIYGDKDTDSPTLKLFDDVVDAPSGATHIIINSYNKAGTAYKSLSVDSTPTEGSSNAASSGSVFNLASTIPPISAKVDVLRESLSTSSSVKTASICTNGSSAIKITNGVISVGSVTASWQYGIIPSKDVKHINTFSGASTTDYPAIVFLRTNEITQASYIEGSAIYGTIATASAAVKRFDSDITVPSGANYIGINLFTAYVDSDTKVTFLKNKVDDLDERVTALDERVTALEATEESSVKIVKKSPSTGEYSTIAAALAAANDGDTIKIYSGIYEEYHLDIIRGLTLIGVGDVEIRGEQPASTELEKVTNWSTLECNQGVKMRNITISAKNLRYPIHADFSNGNSTWDIENCSFIHHGNNEVYEYQVSLGADGSPSSVFNPCSAWGGGTKGGDVVRIKNCRFESTGRAFSTHNNQDDTYSTYGASHVTLENCIMVSHAIDRDNSVYDFPDPIHVQNLDCPVDGCDVVISNCIINGYIVLQNSGGDGFSNNVKIFNCGDFKQCFHSYGSANAAYVSGSQISTYAQHYTGFIMSDFCKSYINRGNSSISAGKAVKKATKGGVAAYDDTSDNVLGIAMEDIAVGAIGIVWVGGFLPRIYFDGIRTTTINEGATIYVDNTGTFATTGTKAAFKAADAQNIDMTLLV